MRPGDTEYGKCFWGWQGSKCKDDRLGTWFCVVKLEMPTGYTNRQTGQEAKGIDLKFHLGIMS